MLDYTVLIRPGNPPIGVPSWATAPSPLTAIALAEELNKAGDSNDNGLVVVEKLSALRQPNAVALQADSAGYTKLIGKERIEFVSFAACTPNTMLAADSEAVLFARSRTSISFYLGDSAEFSAPAIPVAGQPDQYGKIGAGKHCGGFGVTLSPKDPEGFPAATEWRVATSLVQHSPTGDAPVVVQSSGDLSIWSGWRNQPSDWDNPTDNPEITNQNGYVYWDDAARHAIGIQFFSGEGGIFVGGASAIEAGSRKIAFRRDGIWPDGGGVALEVETDSAGASTIVFFSGLSYRKLVDVSDGQVLIPVLVEAPSDSPEPPPAGLFVDRDATPPRLYVAQAPAFKGPKSNGWVGWHFWELLEV